MFRVNNNRIILFDGICNLCNASVNFIIKNDKKNRFVFASLQSDVAKEILLQFSEKKLNLNTLIYFENGVLFEKSTAVLKIAKQLRFPWPIFYVFIIIPAFLRDNIYTFIAKNRYKWFGKKATCMIPAPELKSKFLDT
jgi:predicted DCC family thiol-disulfide oxidoreductase YuxK